MCKFDVENLCEYCVENTPPGAVCDLKQKKPPEGCKFDEKFEQTLKASVWHLYLHKNILDITFYDWEKMSNKHIFLTSHNQLVVCDESEQYRIILTTISRPGDGRVTH